MRLRILLIAVLFVCYFVVSAQDTIAFRSGDLKQSLRIAKKERKTVVLDFYADWCLPCKQMEKHTFSKPEVIAYMNERYVMHRVDMEMFDGMDIGDLYGVKSLPALIYLDKRGKELSRKVGFQTAEDLLED